MLKLILNEQADKALELTGFDRNTSFYENSATSTAYCSVMNAGTAITYLQEVGLSSITHLQINKDDEPIYVLEDQDAHITTINENLSEEQVNISFNIDFRLVKNNQEPTE